MTSGKRVGRKPRTLSPGELRLIEEFAAKLDAELGKLGQEVLCERLKICKASLYNYINEQTLPSYGVLKRAHDEIGFEFPLMDFAAPPKSREHRQRSTDAQGALPFFEPLTTDDFKIIRKKTVERENALELTIQIRLAG
jgi:hypothetical protein